MEIALIILMVLLLIGVAFIVWLVLNRLNVPEVKADDQSMLLLQNQINQLNTLIEMKLTGVDARMGESTKQLQEALRHQQQVFQTQASESLKVIKDVTEQVIEVKNVNQQVLKTTEQLNELQDILKNPKQRGILGEFYLETLLTNTMPPGSFKMQYKFPDGNIVDAVVIVKDKVIPIDSKFSLENYNRLVEEKNPTEREKYEKAFVADLKQRILETSKYIQPLHNTMDFAFMFIPHEAIYYDLLINKIGAKDESAENLIQRAASKYKVIIVSPTSFLAYLQTVLQGLHAMRIEESAKEIQITVRQLQKHHAAYQGYLEKLGKNLSTTVSAFNDANKEFKKIDKDVVKISGSSSLLVEVEEVPKPLSLE